MLADRPLLAPAPAAGEASRHPKTSQETREPRKPEAIRVVRATPVTSWPPDLPVSCEALRQSPLEREAQRELHLPGRAQADGAPDGARQAAERAGGGGRVGLAPLQTIRLRQRGRRNRLRQRADRVREVHGVEQVEYLAAELEIARAAGGEVLGEEEVGLMEARTVDRVALQVAERAWRRRGERRGVQEDHPAIGDERADAGDEIRTGDVARV